jgi:peptidoglycan/LPS O-acetylase OafA/YrhL
VIDFIKIRLFRLWPTMAVGTSIAAAVVWSTYPAPDAALMMLTLVFIPTFMDGRAFALNSPAWSIFFELIANLLHVIVLHKLSTRSLFFVALVALPLFVIPGMAFGLDVGARTANFLIGLPRVMLSYTVGIILWRSWRDSPPIEVPRSFAFLVMPVFFIVTATFDNLTSTTWIANLFFILVFCPLMIAGGLRFDEKSRGAGIAAVAGAFSFPLYAVHIPVIAAASYFGGGWKVSAVAALLVSALFPSVRKALQEALPPQRQMKSFWPLAGRL